MDEFLRYIFRNQWVVFIIPALLLTGGAELGFRFGLRLYVSQDEARKAQISGIQGAILGLLALLLGFTFAMAVNRYDVRRTLVVKEANAIGTTFLRASLLPEAHVAPVEDLLRRYVGLLLKYQPLSKDPVKLAEGLRLTADVHAALWAHALAASREAPTPIVATFINALNETIDTESERIASGRHTVPGSVWLLLLIVAFLGCFTSSYSAGAQGARFPFSSILLPLLITVVVTLVADIANPWRGFIAVSQQSLVDLQQAMGPIPDSGSGR